MREHYDFFESAVNQLRLTVLQHGFIDEGEEWHHKGICSPFSRLYLILNGQGHLSGSEGDVDLFPGNTYLIPLNTTYTYSSPSRIVKFYIHFRLEFAGGYDLFDGVPRCMSVPHEHETVSRIIHLAKSMRVEDCIRCKGELLSTLSQFITMKRETAVRKLSIASKYRTVFSYIEENIRMGLTLKDVANGAGIPYSQLTKNYKKDTGGTLKRFINERLVQKAKELLLFSGMKVKEVAHELSFQDEFYFSRFFKKMTGSSPVEYRKVQGHFKG